MIFTHFQFYSNGVIEREFINLCLMFEPEQMLCIVYLLHRQKMDIIGRSTDRPEN